MKNMIEKRHHYTECGLSNIYLFGLQFSDDNDDKCLIIPCVGVLHELISRILAEQQNTLTGEEFYFLRGELGMNIKTVAENLHAHDSVLQRWQDNNEVDGDIERTFRELVLKSLSEEISVKETEVSSSKQHIKDSQLQGINILHHKKGKTYSRLKLVA